MQWATRLHCQVITKSKFQDGAWMMPFLSRGPTYSGPKAGKRSYLLHRALSDGAIIFVRLLALETPFGSVPVAYQVERVQPMNSSGLCEMRLSQLHPRSRPHHRSEIASPSAEPSSKACEPKESSIQAELEEVLREA